MAWAALNVCHVHVGLFPGACCHAQAGGRTDGHTNRQGVTEGEGAGMMEAKEEPRDCLDQSRAKNRSMWPWGSHGQRQGDWTQVPQCSGEGDRWRPTNLVLKHVTCPN
ncbi:predicted protein [Chaetomium globosum CBS 148.51]|uniref:Secreted protein n=1 Tax=Chaetomium globosum (strain ATCC 6205 / CBS 148.51 / DSM 1962 / NBRC 6347 / NRRL 1970) TaxID=306901 RepID=Q2GW08_CHAGB|nr:uncharacterized protein CHGG_07846 [Chaetomium globosum CBS 148.51]EAQ86593.1 predicted protein [Chaetomium globosum CBS 148.51]